MIADQLAEAFSIEKDKIKIVNTIRLPEISSKNISGETLTTTVINGKVQESQEKLNENINKMYEYSKKVYLRRLLCQSLILD